MRDTEGRHEVLPDASVPPRGHAVQTRTLMVDLLVLALALGLAVLLRIELIPFKSVDYYSSLRPWYNTIKDEGFSAFGSGFSNYNPPYLYALYAIARLLPDLPLLTAVKLPSMIADFICATFVWLIVREAHPSRRVLPIVAGLAVLFSPTVFLNSAFWGQADSQYTAAILACVYFLMRRTPGVAVACFGIALAFKLQAVFLAPVILALAARGIVPWKWLATVPAALILALLPAWAAGRPFGDLLSVYADQASQYELMTMNAPSVYALLPGAKRVFNLLYIPGVILGAAAAFSLFVIVAKGLRVPGQRQLVALSLASMLVVPLFLPKMHERYFYPADVLSIAFAFLYPRFLVVPLFVLGASFAAYHPFLFGYDLAPLPVLTLVLLAATAIVLYFSIRQLYSGPTDMQAASKDNSGSAPVDPLEVPH